MCVCNNFKPLPRGCNQPKKTNAMPHVTWFSGLTLRGTAYVPDRWGEPANARSNIGFHLKFLNIADKVKVSNKTL